MKKAKQNVKTPNKNVVKKQDKNKKALISSDNEMLKLIILILIVAVVFGIFYVITLFITKDDTTNTNPTDESNTVTIQYDEILAGNILEQKESEYYVLVYYPEDQYVPLYMNHLSYYKMTVENAVRYYTVDMSDIFNKQFVGEESVLNVTDSKDFKFSQTALLRIKNGKVISTYESKDVITAKFGRMTK